MALFLGNRVLVLSVVVIGWLSTEGMLTDAVRMRQF